MTAVRDQNDLTQRIKAGDARAYEQLLCEYGPRLLNTARRMCRNDADANDVLQDAMVQCIRNVADFKGDSSISTWLHRIVVTTALMRLRKRKRRNEAAIEPLLPTFTDDGHRIGARGEPEWTDTADELAGRKELCEIVRNSIDSLPDLYRDVLILRDIEQMDTAAAGEVLGVNEGVVKTRLHRARQALKALLTPIVAGTQGE